MLHCNWGMRGNGNGFFISNIFENRDSQIEQPEGVGFTIYVNRDSVPVSNILNNVGMYSGMRK